MELIPGLPDELARECLIRIPFLEFRVARSVCKGWRAEIGSPEYRLRREAAGHIQELLVIAHVAKVEDTTRLSLAPGANFIYLQVLSAFEPQSGRWSTLPQIPVFSQNVQLIRFRLFHVGMDLVAVGHTVNQVYIYSFLTSQWRRGADMPGTGCRSGFGCATDGERMIYVAGGRDRVPLNSAMAYDVKTDKWETMPDMVLERSQCGAAFFSGRFVVTCWFPPPALRRDIYESFDPVVRCWDGPFGEAHMERSLGFEQSYFAIEDGYMTYRKGTSRRLIGKVALMLDEFHGPEYHLYRFKGQERLVVIEPHALEVYLVDLSNNLSLTQIQVADPRISSSSYLSVSIHGHCFSAI